MKSLMPIKSIGDSERMIYGYVMVSDVVDEHNDRISKEEVKKAAERFLINYPDQWVGINTNHTPSYARLTQSSVIEEDGLTKWLVGVKILNDYDWEKILKNGCTGFSYEAVSTQTKNGDVFDNSDIVVTNITVLYPDPEHNKKNEPANPESVATLVKSVEGQTIKEIDMKPEEVKTIVAEEVAKVEAKLPTLEQAVTSAKEEFSGVIAKMQESIEGLKALLAGEVAKSEGVVLAKSKEELAILVKQVEANTAQQIKDMQDGLQKKIDAAAGSTSIDPTGTPAVELKGRARYEEHVKGQLAKA